MRRSLLPFTTNGDEIAFELVHSKYSIINLAINEEKINGKSQYMNPY